MQKVLNQQEINALVRGSRQAVPGETAGRKRDQVTPCDFRRAAQITTDQVRWVSMLHERFAASVGNSLGAYLRVGFEMNLVSVEQLLYDELLHRFPDPTYLASLSIRPLAAEALLQLDLSVAFTMIDLVLGGPGVGDAEARGVTEIEEQILESVVRVICRQVQETWRIVLPLEIQFGHRHLAAQAQGLMLATEKVMSLGFEIRMPAASGMLNLVFPAAVSNALLRKLAVQWTYARALPDAAVRERLWARLLKSQLAVELRVPPVRVPIAALLALREGSILALPHRVADPVRLAVSGRDFFRATPVSCGTYRGARVAELLPAEAGGQE